ncbi:MAG: site-specific DNA-methyltransferase [Chrysiogenetes bacterium]|nr:site-specific DNA-methyltransferase [Chrysiogenetes bacterium]
MARPADKATDTAFEPRVFDEQAIQSPGGSNYRLQVGEYWTARQRQMHPLHYAVSYRASFKPELPDYFIRRYTRPGEIVFDPFSGRGTTALQANLLGRVAWSADVSPLAERLVYPKTHPVSFAQIEERLSQIDFEGEDPASDRARLKPFYHAQTRRELHALRAYLSSQRDDVDRFIELIALSRLHGHSAGFFSRYSFPQISVSPRAQERINRTHDKTASYRCVPKLISRKAKRTLGDESALEIRKVSAKNRHWVADVRDLTDLPAGKVSLIVTSPPFLNKADYIQDNWLENWFLGIEPESYSKGVVQTHDLPTWETFIRGALFSMHRALKSGGHAVIEVGEVVSRKELVHLDERVVAMAESLAGDGQKWDVREVLIQQQEFTKLANCFAVDNNKKGTNTNRMVVLRKV